MGLSHGDYSLREILLVSSEESLVSGDLILESAEGQAENSFFLLPLGVQISGREHASCETDQLPLSAQD